MRSITAKDATQFSQVWRHNGIAIPMQDCHMQFAADFANIVLKSFIEDAQKARAAAIAKAEEAAKPKIIMEGV